MRRAIFRLAVLGAFIFVQSAQADWLAAKRLTWNSGTSFEPTVVVDSSGNIYVAWEDTTPGNHEIYYKKSTDGGATWTANKRLTWNLGNSSCPAVAVDSNGVHIVYQDWTPGMPRSITGTARTGEKPGHRANV